MPWIIDEVEDMIQSSLGIEQLSSLHIEHLKSKSWVSNEFLDLITCYDMPEQGLNKLIIREPLKICEPIQEEVVTRISNMCPNLSHLELSDMYALSEAGRLSMVCIFTRII